MNKIEGSNFYIEELFPLEFIKHYTPEKITRFIPIESFRMLQRVRDFFGRSITVNDKCFGGKYNYSGYRYLGCGEGAENGEHYRGLAFDIKVKGVDSLTVRELLIKNYELLGITMIEDGMEGWNHISCPWFHGHELDLAIFDKTENIIRFKDAFELQKYKVNKGKGDT